MGQLGLFDLSRRYEGLDAKAIKDRDFAEKQIAEGNVLLAQAAEMTESVYQTVRTKIGS